MARSSAGTLCDHIIISSCSLGRRIWKKLGRRSCIILPETARQKEAGLQGSFRLQEVRTRSPFTVLHSFKRNPEITPQAQPCHESTMSLFWMEPALGDAVISSVRSDSRPDSSHQKTCLLEISHMTAGGAKAVLTRLLPLAVVLFVNGLVSLCRLRGLCCA